jgi:hypothetical protein
VFMHSSSVWRRTEPIAAAARGAVELLALEADDEGGGRGKIWKGVEGVVACFTGPIIELTAARAVWYVRARIVSCAGVQKSDLCSTALSSSVCTASELYSCAHALKHERTSLRIYNPHGGQNAAQSQDSMGQLHGALLACNFASDARLHSTATAPGPALV